MRQITTREKAFLSIGALVAVAIFVYFVLLPMLQNGGPKQKSSLEEMQEKLAAVQQLANMSSMLVDVAGNISEQSGYKKASFKRGSANAAIIKYIAQNAQDAGIKELEQLDARPDTRRKKQTEASGRQDVLGAIGAIIDRMYMGQVRNEMKQEEDDNIESDGQENSSQDKDEAKKVEETTTPDISEEPAEVEQLESTGTVFPPIPRGESISDDVRQALVKSIEARQGKTLDLKDINEILDVAGVLDAERTQVRKRLQLYSNGVDKKKSEMRRHFGKLGVSKSAKSGQQMEIFSIKMVFKSRIDQLVRFMYNLQDSARWIRMDSMRIGIADRKETVLSVELSMTATALYNM